jgi:hypothetical protein
MSALDVETRKSVLQLRTIDPNAKLVSTRQKRAYIHGDSMHKYSCPRYQDEKVSLDAEKFLSPIVTSVYRYPRAFEESIPREERE